MTELKIVKNRPNQAVVEALEDLLVEAKEGRLLEFDLVGRYESGQILNAWCGKNEDVFMMFGKLMDRALSYRERNID